jgi:nitrogen fixation NifU-like protein
MELQEELSAFDRFVAELQREIDEREQEIYSAKVIEAARNPRNLGRMAAPDAQAIVRGWCGDTMEVYLRLDGHLIQEATFMTDGCGPSLACGSTLTIMLQGLSLEEALQIKPEDVIDALDGLPEDSTHCAELAVTTLQKAVSHWQK